MNNEDEDETVLLNTSIEVSGNESISISTNSNAPSLPTANIDPNNNSISSQQVNVQVKHHIYLKSE